MHQLLLHYLWMIQSPCISNVRYSEFDFRSTLNLIAFFKSYLWVLMRFRIRFSLEIKSNCSNWTFLRWTSNIVHSRKSDKLLTLFIITKVYIPSPLCITLYKKELYKGCSFPSKKPKAKNYLSYSITIFTQDTTNTHFTYVRKDFHIWYTSLNIFPLSIIDSLSWIIHEIFCSVSNLCFLFRSLASQCARSRTT